MTMAEGVSYVVKKTIFDISTIECHLATRIDRDSGRNIYYGFA